MAACLATTMVPSSPPSNKYHDNDKYVDDDDEPTGGNNSGGSEATAAAAVPPVGTSNSDTLTYRPVYPSLPTNLRKMQMRKAPSFSPPYVLAAGL